MAPGAARWPEEICAPSKAGPVGEEQARTRVALPSRISALVPTSTTSISSSESCGDLGEGDRGGVGADVAGDAGQEVDAGVLVQAELDLLGPEVERVGGGEREGRHAELGRVDAEDEVVHDRVADDHRLEDELARDAGLGRRLAGEVVEGGADGAGHLPRAAGVQHRVADPAHQILAEADLRVHQAGGGEDLAGGEVAEVAGDGGGADVDGEAVDAALVEAGPDVQDARLGAVVVDGAGDLPLALAQRRAAASAACGGRP